MKNKRKHNDIFWTWTITRDGEAEDLTGALVSLFDCRGRRCEIEYAIDGNVVSGVFRGKVQKESGVYTMVLTENAGADGMTEIDEVKVWCLVEHTWQEGGDDEEGVSTTDVNIESNIEEAKNGVGIDRIVTTRSTEDEGMNVVTIVLDNGIRYSFDVRNGSKGEKGDAGHSPVITADKTGGVLSLYVDGVKVGEVSDGQDGQDADITEIIENFNAILEKADQKIEEMDEAIEAAVYSEGTAISAGLTLLDADGEDFTSEGNVLKLADRDTDDGKGYVIVRKGTQLSSLFPSADTIYEIRYDINLEGNNVAVPSGCVLKFEGGSFSNGTLTGDSTEISGEIKDIFASTINIAGTWNVHSICSSMIADASTANALRILVALSNADVQNTIDIEAGDYYFTFTKELEAGLELKSNTELIVNGNLHLNANGLTQYRIIRAKNCKNIKIHGSGLIDGDKDDHDYTKEGEHEFGNGIFVVKSTDVDISGVEVQNCTGDAITLSQGSSSEYGSEMLPNKRIRISGVKLHDCRRQGISVTFAENLVIENCDIYDIVGAMPMSGIDVEPNASDTGMWGKNIEIRNTRITGDCKAGIIFDCDSSKTNAAISNVLVDNCFIDLTGEKMTSGLGFRYVNQAVVKGCTISGTAALYAPEKGQKYLAYGMQVEYSIEPRIENCIITNNSSYTAMFTMGNTNLKIKGCTITDTADGAAAFRKCNNLTIEDCDVTASKLIYVYDKNNPIKGWHLVRSNLSLVIDAQNDFKDSIFESNTIASVNWQDKTITGVKLINNSIGNFLCTAYNEGSISGNTFTGTFKIGGMNNIDFVGNVYSPAESVESPVFTLSNIKKCSISDNRINCEFDITNMSNTRFCHNVLTAKFVMNGTWNYNTIDSNIITATDNTLIIRGNYSTISNNYILAKVLYTYTQYTTIENNVFVESVTATTDDGGNDTTSHAAVFLYMNNANNVFRNNTIFISNDNVVRVVYFNGTFMNSIIDSNIVVGTIPSSSYPFSPILGANGYISSNTYINNRIPSIGSTNPDVNSLDVQNTGHMFYNTTDKKCVVWDGTEWVDASGNDL